MRSRSALALAGTVATLAAALAWLALRMPGGTGDPAAGGMRETPTRSGRDTELFELSSSDAEQLERTSIAERAGLPVAGLTGRVIDSDAGTGLEGFWACLRRPVAPLEDEPGSNLLAQARSGSSGHFVLPAEAPSGAWVEVEPASGWRMLESSLPASQPLVFRARRARSAPFRALLVDDMTGEVVPYCQLALRTVPRWSRIDVVSDVQGLCVTDLEIEEGPLAVELIDDPRIDAGRRNAAPPQQVLHSADPAAAPVELRVSVGPTFRLDLRLPTELEPDRLHALLVLPGARSLEREERYRRIPLRLDPEGGLPWVRFPWDSTAMLLSAEGTQVQLVVRDQPCEHRGVATVRTAWGVYPQVVSVGLAAAALVQVEVRQPDGEPIQGAAVALGDGTGRELASKLTDPSGRARFAGLAPGEYLVRASHRQFQRGERALSALPGQVTEAGLILGRAAVAGAVEGRAVGGPRWRQLSRVNSMEVHLSSSDGAGRFFALPLSFQQDGPQRWVANFCFADIPAGSYACSISAYDPRYWWPQRLEVSPPTSGLEFAETPAGTLVPVGIDVVDEVDGASLPAAVLWLHVSGARTDIVCAASRTREYVHPQAEMLWGVGAPEHAPRFGTRADLELSEGALVARVELARGFGLRLAVTDPSGTPLANVQVQTDGAPAGATGSEGLLILAAQSPPRELHLEHALWQEPSSLAAAFSAAVAAGEPQLAVALQPR